MAEKLPRKLKKKYIGKRMNKRALKALIESTTMIEHKYPETPTILPFEFCPDCGCREVRCTGEMASYPETWVEEYCARCNSYVGGADNSRYHHVLEDIIVERAEKEASKK